MPIAEARRADQRWVTYIVYVLTGVACGILIWPTLSGIIVGFTGGGVDMVAAKLISFAVFYLMLYAASYIQTVIHESGHLVGGLLSGYGFGSFRIGKWMWIKRDGRVAFSKLPTPAGAGQCLMSPPELKDGKMPVMLYHLGGALMNLAASVALAGIALALPEASIARAALFMLAFIGLAIAINNGVPLRLGIANNDGFNALESARSSEAVRATWIMLKTTELLSRGVRLKDMPAEWFAPPDDGEMGNSLVATIAVLSCERLVEEKRFDEARAQIEHALAVENGMVEIQRRALINDRLFIELITDNRPDWIAGALDKAQRKYMKTRRGSIGVLRTEYALALLSRGDMVEAAQIRARFDKAASAHPYPADVEGELELIAIVDEAHRTRRAAQT